MEENKSIAEFLLAYQSGQRKFDGWDFDEDASVAGMDLRDVHFENCFLFLDFRNANLKGASFINCNIKTADFSGANLENATIKNCPVECIILEKASTKNMTFEGNGYFGITLNQEDLEKIKNN